MDRQTAEIVASLTLEGNADEAQEILAGADRPMLSRGTKTRLIDTRNTAFVDAIEPELADDGWSFANLEDVVDTQGGKPVPNNIHLYRSGVTLCMVLVPRRWPMQGKTVHFLMGNKSRARELQGLLEEQRRIELAAIEDR